MSAMSVINDAHASTHKNPFFVCVLRSLFIAWFPFRSSPCMIGPFGPLCLLSSLCVLFRGQGRTYAWVGLIRLCRCLAWMVVHLRGSEPLFGRDPDMQVGRME